MKTYKEYEKVCIGDSDKGCVDLIGGTYMHHVLNFGEDATYKAYVVDENAVIGDHYKKVAMFRDFMYIFDDIGLSKKFNAKVINVYRAGEMGCIIQCIN